MKEREMWVNGVYVPVSKVGMHPYSAGAMYGIVCFTMTRSFDKKHWKLLAHIDRIFNGIKLYEIPIKITKEELIGICNDVCEHNKRFFNKDDEFRIMINVFPGNLSIYPGNHDAVIMVDVFPLRLTVSGMGKLYATGVNAVIPSQRTIPFQYLDQRIKNRNRLHFYMANLEVSRMQGENNWALLLDDRGFIAEGCGDNFFIVKDGKFYTPKALNILKGISREFIKELAVDKVFEINMTPLDVMNADEAFYTATPFCIMPVTRFQGHSIRNGKPGWFTNELLGLWSDFVGINIVQQIKDWDKKYKSDLSFTPYQHKRKKI